MRIILALAVVYLLAAYSHALQTPQGVIAVGAITLLIFLVSRLPEILLAEGMNCQNQGRHAASLKRFGFGIAIAEYIYGAEHAIIASLHEAMAKSYASLCDPLKAAASAHQAKSIRRESRHQSFGTPKISQSVVGTKVTPTQSWVYRLECAHVIGLIAVLIVPAIPAVARNINLLHLSSAASRTLLVRACDFYADPLRFSHASLFTPLRDRAEQLYLQRKYSAAAKLLKKHLESNSVDEKAQLDLGKVCIALGQFEQAISPLSTARCQIHCRLLELEYEKESAFGASYPKYKPHARRPVYCAALDSLTEEQCHAVDGEARRCLENAVLAVAEKIDAPESKAVTLYKHDRPFSVMQACLKLARRFHNEAGIDRLDAMYQLAEESAVDYPSDLIIACSVQAKNREEVWDKLAQVALNARTEREQNWAYGLLLKASTALPQTDLRRAAGVHYVCSREYVDDSERTFALEKALKECQAAVGDKSKSLHLANCYYDFACRQLDDGTPDAGAGNFQKALDLYQSNQGPSMASQLDVADTHYNLGMSSFAIGHLEEARNHFREGLRIYEQLAQQASSPGGASRWTIGSGRRACEFNLAVLAAEFAPNRADEPLLLRRAANHDVVSLAQLGLYYFELKDFAKAEEALVSALSLYFPAEAGQAPTLQGATNGTIEPHGYSDLAYDEAAVFAQFFHRAPRLNEFVGTRYARSSAGQRVGCYGALLRHDVYPDYRLLVGELYKRLLKEQDRKIELRLFESRALLPELPSCDQFGFENSKQYTEALGDILRRQWFCPPNISDECVIASVRINKQGMMSLACDEPRTVNANLRSVHDSVVDLSKFALLPAPPPDWNEHEDLTVVFDASKLLPAPPGMMTLCSDDKY